MSGLVRMDAVMEVQPERLDCAEEAPPGAERRGAAVDSVQERISRFATAKFERNLELGNLSMEQSYLARTAAAEHCLMHNIPRPQGTGTFGKTRAPHALKRSRSIELHGLYCWKPQPREKEMMDILCSFKEDRIAPEYIFPRDLSCHDRYVAHSVAEVLDLEHQSFGTEEGRVLRVWKPSAHQPPPLQGSRSTEFPATAARQLSQSDTAFTRMDTWIEFGAAPGFGQFTSLCEGTEPDTPVATAAAGGGVGDIKKGLATKTLDSSGALHRQISMRVIEETQELEAKVRRPSQPTRLTTGTGEVYQVVDHGTGTRAIFKPAVQPGQTSRRGGGLGDIQESPFSDSSDEIKTPLEDPADLDVQTQTHRKEVAAYLLDHFGFAGVLPTIESKVELQGSSTSGMIQKYLEHEQTADEDEWGRRQINALPRREVHTVGALDIRIFNCDRHGGNLLLDEVHEDGVKRTRLVPIDHELTLPPWRKLDSANFCWLSWPQAKEPFDLATEAYIRQLDPQRDVDILRSLDLSPECIATYRICCHLLKICAARGLRLYDIGNMMVRAPGVEHRSTSTSLQFSLGPSQHDVRRVCPFFPPFASDA